MLCPNCHQEFNSTQCLPRILVYCGHTYCHTCIESLLEQDSETSKISLKCPECLVINHAAEGVNSFPKNLVLLQVSSTHQISSSTQQVAPSANSPSSVLPSNTHTTNIVQSSFSGGTISATNNKLYNENQKLKEGSNTGGDSANKNSSRETQKQFGHSSSQSNQVNSRILCSDHNKKLEAFCEKDLKALCIDCILGDQHKNHEIISVQKAVEKQRQFMFDQVGDAQNNEEKLRFLTNDIKRHINEMQSQAERNRKEISSIYSFIRELILEREQNLKKQISSNLSREEEECQNKLKEINEFHQLINSIKQELVQQSQETDIDILQKSKQRLSLCQEVNGQRGRDLVQFNILQVALTHQSLLEIKREQELAQISKIVHPQFKGNSGTTNGALSTFGFQAQYLNQGQTQSSGAGGGVSSLYSHTLSTANKMKKSHTVQDKQYVAGSYQQQISNVGGGASSCMNNNVSGSNSCNQNSSTNLDAKLVKEREDVYFKNGGCNNGGAGGVPYSKQSKNKGKGNQSPHRNSRKNTVEGFNKKEKNQGVNGNGVVVLDQKQGGNNIVGGGVGKGSNKYSHKQQYIMPHKQSQQSAVLGSFGACMTGLSNHQNFNQQEYLQGKDMTTYYYEKNTRHHFVNQQAEDYIEEMGGGDQLMGNGVDDVSSICPLDQNECYYNYSPKTLGGGGGGFGKQQDCGGQQVNTFKFKGKNKIMTIGDSNQNINSEKNLDDLLESLNKSSNQDNIQKVLENPTLLNKKEKNNFQRESSTASETGGSTNNGLEETASKKQEQIVGNQFKQQLKTLNETPKEQKKQSQWKMGGIGCQLVNHQQLQQTENSSSNKKLSSTKKKNLKKENSASEFEEFKNLQSKIQSPLRKDKRDWAGEKDSNVYNLISTYEKQQQQSREEQRNSSQKRQKIELEGEKIHTQRRSESLNKYQSSCKGNIMLGGRGGSDVLTKKRTQYYYNMGEQGNDYEDNKQEDIIEQDEADDNQNLFQNSSLPRNSNNPRGLKKQNSHSRSQISLSQERKRVTGSGSKHSFKMIQQQIQKGNMYGAAEAGQISSSNNSPFKEGSVNIVGGNQKLLQQEEERQQLMVMIQECSKNIEKIEFKPSLKKVGKECSLGTSPLKQYSQSKTAVCCVDLTKREGEEEEEQDKSSSLQSPLKNQDPILETSPSNPQLYEQQQDRQSLGLAALVKEDEMDEFNFKKLPNVSAQKENSPFKDVREKQVKELVFQLRFGDDASPKLKQQLSSPPKQLVQQDEEESKSQQIQEQNSKDSPIKYLASPVKSCNAGGSGHYQIDNQSNDESQIMTCSKSQFNSLSNTQINNHNNNMMMNCCNNTVSADTSVADPFRALCRMKEEFVFVFSGFNDTKLFTCECFDVQRGIWKEIAQIGKPRTKFAAVPISKSRILLFGGKQTDGQRTGEIEEYNLKTNKFKTLPFKMPKARSGFAACVKREEGKIFFCGGNSSSVLRKFDCLDLKKGKWSKLPEMIQKRDELAVALGPDGKIYAIGGYGGGGNNNNAINNSQQIQNESGTAAAVVEKSTDGKQQSNCLKTAERYDFNTGQWEMLPEMNEARRALAAVALPDGIYAIGGYDGKQYLDTVEKFDLQQQRWIQVQSMQKSRCTLAAVASSDFQYIYALGGFNGSSLDMVERYDIISDKWELMTPMLSKRFMHEAVSLITH